MSFRDSVAFSFGTGIALAPDGQSVFFLADLHYLVQVEYPSGRLLAIQCAGPMEDIEVLAK